MSDTLNAAAAGAAIESEWTNLVTRIRAGDTSGMTELYDVFSHGIRFYLCRQLGMQDVEDRVHEVFLSVVQSILRGDVHQPDRLMGYIRTILRRQVASEIDGLVRERRHHAGIELGELICDRSPDPEQAAMHSQNVDLALRVLQGLRPRDREVLVRFYLREQRPEEICRELVLNATQFRLIKSRAKSRFIRLVRRRLALRQLFHL